MQGEYITTVQWAKIQDFLRQFSNLYVSQEKNYRNFIEGVYWMTRSGTRWRDLPERYGRWNSVYKRFRRWTQKGIWEKFFDFCIQDPDLENVLIDSTIIRAHPCAAGYGNQEVEGFGRSRGGFTSKIHALADALGNPLKFIVTPGQQNDARQALTLLQNVTGANVIGDKAYDSDEIRTVLAQQRCIAVIPSRSNRNHLYEYDKHLYKERHAIECLFFKIKNFRRIFSRFDKSLQSFMAMLFFVGAFIWLR